MRTVGVVAGVVVLPENSPLERPLRMIQRHKGSVAAPFDCWLALRGLQTLPLRMRAHCEGAQSEESTNLAQRSNASRLYIYHTIHEYRV